MLRVDSARGVMLGHTIGHYRILRKIGEGGMGQVFLAEDARLERNVAVKVLAQPTPNPDQVARFHREAKAAAALDHPNILAIHEFGQDGATPYVVMELLDGRNLREHLAHGPLAIQTALDYAREVVKGLAAAHDKGIWHRDLKPENIFITHDGRVKILDFGLTNIRDSGTQFAAAGPDQTREALTQPGLVLGTMGYMAPEQVRGERVDGRADIFAFGAVLFEMLTSRRAFSEPTAVETLHGILKTPPPMQLLSDAGATPALVDLVGRCLEKERDRRYQSAREVETALLAAAREAAASPPSPTPAAGQRLDSWKEIAAYLGRGVRTVQRWEREEQLPVRRLPHAKRDSVYADREELARWWKHRQRTATETPLPTPRGDPPLPTPRAEPPRPLAAVERLTNASAVISSPALSSDARVFAYVSDHGDGAAPQVWLQQVGGRAIRLTSGQRECGDCTFSADDTRIFFTAKGDDALNIYEVPTFGGEPRLVKRNARAGRCSPDGKWFTYISLDSPRRLRLASLVGDAEKTLAPDFVDVTFAVWSPDSKYVLARGRPNATLEPDYWIVPIEGGTPVNTGMILKVRPRGVVLDWPPAWTKDAAVFTAGTREGQVLWRQRFTPDPFEMIGDPEPLTRATEWAYSPTAAAGRLAFVSGHPDMNLWSIPLDPATGAASGPPARATRGQGIMACLSATADGRTVAYFTTRLSKPEMFLRDMDRGLEAIVAAAPGNIVNVFPAISPSGRKLAHGIIVPSAHSRRPVFIVDVATGTSHRVCDDCGARPRQWIDERDLLLETFGAGRSSVLLMDTTSGAHREVLASDDHSVTNPRVSPDGRWIAFDAAPASGLPGVYIAPFDRAGIRRSEWVIVEDEASYAFWSLDGRLLYYLPATPHRDVRSVVRGRRFNPESGQLDGERFVAVTLRESVIPVLTQPTTPVVVPNQIVAVLADLRGEIWMMDA
jgi:serine/threonine protein kinase/Tol biopolymer transport system component